MFTYILKEHQYYVFSQKDGTGNKDKDLKTNLSNLAGFDPRQGWCLDNCGEITIGEIFLMLAEGIENFRYFVAIFNPTDRWQKHGGGRNVVSIDMTYHKFYFGYFILRFRDDLVKSFCVSK